CQWLGRASWPMETAAWPPRAWRLSPRSRVPQPRAWRRGRLPFSVVRSPETTVPLPDPLQAAAHALLQVPRGAVVQLRLGLFHGARDGLVHLGQDMDLLMIEAKALQRLVHHPGHLAGHAWQAHALVRADLAEFRLQQSLHRVDDLVHGVGLRIR